LPQPQNAPITGVDSFEQAVIAIASLYFYANRCQIPVQIWTAATGLVHGNRAVLEVLAATQMQEAELHPLPQDAPIIWLTQTVGTLTTLSEASRWLLWPLPQNQQPTTVLKGRGHLITPDASLQQQLQQPLQLRTSVSAT
ncbi:MAG: hypothetical protein AAGF24_12075, partial [Cyanobacteria bacterium P01_H01_bin.121]